MSIQLIMCKRTATRCNTLQRAATHRGRGGGKSLLIDFHSVYDVYKHCTTLQHTATYCYTLQHTATRCNTLQHTATHCYTLQHTATNDSMRQHTITHCNTMQHTAARCNTLQHAATRCNVLQNTEVGAEVRGCYSYPSSSSRANAPQHNAAP